MEEYEIGKKRRGKKVQDSYRFEGQEEMEKKGGEKKEEEGEVYWKKTRHKRRNNEKRGTEGGKGQGKGQ